MIPSTILQFAWRSASGVHGEDWERLVGAYRKVARDPRDLDLLMAEAQAAASEGGLFAVLNAARRLSGYMACLIAMSDQGPVALIRQWYKDADSKETAMAATDSFLEMARVFARKNGAERIIWETRAVDRDGSVRRRLLRMLKKAGFAPIYAGFESKIGMLTLYDPRKSSFCQDVVAVKKAKTLQELQTVHT